MSLEADVVDNLHALVINLARDMSSSFVKFCDQAKDEFSTIKPEAEALLLRTNDEYKDAMEGMEYLREKLNFHHDMQLPSGEISEEIVELEDRMQESRVAATLLKNVISAMTRIMTAPLDVIEQRHIISYELEELLSLTPGQPPHLAISTFISSLQDLFRNIFATRKSSALVDYATGYEDLRHAVEFICDRAWASSAGLQAFLSAAKIRGPRARPAPATEVPEIPDFDPSLFADLCVDHRALTASGLAGDDDGLTIDCFTNSPPVVMPPTPTPPPLPPLPKRRERKVVRWAEDECVHIDDEAHEQALAEEARLDALIAAREGEEGHGVPADAAACIAESLRDFSLDGLDDAASDDSCVSVAAGMRVAPATMPLAEMLADAADEEGVPAAIRIAERAHGVMLRLHHTFADSAPAPADPTEVSLSEWTSLLLFRPLLVLGRHLEAWAASLDRLRALPGSRTHSAQLSTVWSMLDAEYALVEQALRQGEQQGHAHAVAARFPTDEAGCRAGLALSDDESDAGMDSDFELFDARRNAPLPPPPCPPVPAPPAVEDVVVPAGVLAAPPAAGLAPLRALPSYERVDEANADRRLRARDLFAADALAPDACSHHTHPRAPALPPACSPARPVPWLGAAYLSPLPASPLCAGHACRAAPAPGNPFVSTDPRHELWNRRVPAADRAVPASPVASPLEASDALLDRLDAFQTRTALLNKQDAPVPATVSAPAPTPAPVAVPVRVSTPAPVAPVSPPPAPMPAARVAPVVHNTPRRAPADWAALPASHYGASPSAPRRVLPAPAAPLPSRFQEDLAALTPPPRRPRRIQDAAPVVEAPQSPPAPVAPAPAPTPAVHCCPCLHTQTRAEPLPQPQPQREDAAVAAELAEADRLLRALRASTGPSPAQARYEQQLAHLEARVPATPTARPPATCDADHAAEAEDAAEERRLTMLRRQLRAASNAAPTAVSAPAPVPAPSVTSRNGVPASIRALPRSLGRLSARDGAVCAPPQTLPLAWGMGLANTSNRSGVLVQAPQPGGLAALLSLQPGDRLVYVNNRLVREASEWHWAMGMAEQDVRDGLSALLSVQVMRGSNRVVVYVPIVLQ